MDPLRTIAKMFGSSGTSHPTLDTPPLDKKDLLSKDPFKYLKKIQTKNTKQKTKHALESIAEEHPIKTRATRPKPRKSRKRNGDGDLLDEDMEDVEGGIEEDMENIEEEGDMADVEDTEQLDMEDWEDGLEELEDVDDLDEVADDVEEEPEDVEVDEEMEDDNQSIMIE